MYIYIYIYIYTYIYIYIYISLSPIGINNLVVGLLIVSVIKLMKDTTHPFASNVLNLCIKYLFV